MEINPRVVFERMFGRAGHRRRSGWRGCSTNRSILDSVRGDVADARARARARATACGSSEYLENVREIEQRIQRAEKQATTELTVPDAPVGMPESFEEHVGAACSTCWRWRTRPTSRASSPS